MIPEIAHRLYGPDDALILACGLVVVFLFALVLVVGGIFMARIQGE